MLIATGVLYLSDNSLKSFYWELSVSPCMVGGDWLSLFNNSPVGLDKRVPLLNLNPDLGNACLEVSGPDLGCWVGCGGCVLVLDPLLLTETTSNAASREERGVAQGASSKGAPRCFSFPPSLKDTGRPRRPDHPTKAMTCL